MVTEARRSDVSSFALRVAERPRTGDWVVLVASPDQLDEAVSELVEALSDLGEDAVHTVVESAEEVIAAQREGGLQVLSGLSRMADNEWARLDRQRSRLMIDGVTVLVLTPEAMANLSRHAPNFPELDRWGDLDGGRVHPGAVRRGSGREAV